MRIGFFPFTKTNLDNHANDNFNNVYVFFCFTGVLALPVVDMLGLRLSALLGAMLAMTGLLLTSILNEFYILYLTYGIFTGWLTLLYCGHCLPDCLLTFLPAFLQ